MPENIEIYTYQRTGKDRKKTRGTSGIKKVGKQLSRLMVRVGQAVTPGTAAIFLAGFFLGRAVLLGELVPFGAAFAAAAIRVFGRTGLLAVPAVIAGFATVSSGATLAGSVLTVVCIWIMIRLIPLDVQRPWLVLPGMVLAVTVIVKTSILAFTSPSSYSYFSVLFEAVFAALLTTVMVFGLGALKKKVGGVHLLTGEEIFCVLLILGGLIAGTGELKYELFSVKGILSRFTILLAALVGGSGAGAAAGAVVGIIPGLAYTVAPAIIGAYSFAGLLAGISRSYGKAGVATGFLLGNIILSVYITDYGNIVGILGETAIASLLFMLIPSFFIKDIQVSLGLQNEKERETAGNKIPLKEVFEDKIKNWARVFHELSRTFEQVSSTAGQGREEQSLQKLFNQVSEKVCVDCSFYRTCWEREFYKTYQGLIDLVALVEIYGKVSPDNLPVEIKRRCARTKELAITISCLYENYNLNRYWSRRLLESREIVSEQLKGISEVMAKLPGEMEFEAEAGEMGPVLRKKLKEAGTQVETLAVCPREAGGVEVSLTHSSCAGKMECRDVIAPVLSKLLEQPMYRATRSCTVKEGDHNCQLRLYPELNYRLVLGAAGIGKSGSFVSGDNYSFFHLKGGRFALVLSDGMGTGPRAALESGTTISLLRHLLESGFGQDLAVKTVNSILVLRSPGESFATVDMVLINLYTGEAEFVKISAVPTFLIREGQVEQIKASSLPVGIVDDIEVASLSKTLALGDVLVMVSDGVLESYQGAGDREEWLADVLLDIGEIPPQEMAELILKLAQTGAGGASRVPDDMTILVARLEKQKDPTGRKTGLR